MSFVTAGSANLTLGANGHISIGNDLTVSTNLFVGGDSVADAHICNVPFIYYGELDGTTSYPSGGILRYTGGTVVNPRGLYAAALYTFTAPRACYVEIYASATISSTSPGQLQVLVYKGFGELAFLFNVVPGFGNATGSGTAVVLCASGDTLTLRCCNICTLASGGLSTCTFKVL